MAKINAARQAFDSAGLRALPWPWSIDSLLNQAPDDQIQ
jgi:hypothetical protein